MKKTGQYLTVFICKKLCGQNYTSVQNLKHVVTKRQRLITRRDFIFIYLFFLLFYEEYLYHRRFLIT